MSLSENFTLSEMIFSDRANMEGIDNSPQTPEIEKNLTALAVNVLQPTRDVHGVLTVMSGYRCEALNDKIEGSSDTSQHMKGEAADITNDNIVAVFHWLVYSSGLDFDQMILYTKRNFIHISHTTRRKNRHMVSFNSGKSFEMNF